MISIFMHFDIFKWNFRPLETVKYLTGRLVDDKDNLLMLKIRVIFYDEESYVWDYFVNESTNQQECNMWRENAQFHHSIAHSTYNPIWKKLI